MSTTHKKGTSEQREDFIDFINLVFGYNGSTSGFMKLLPKLYDAARDPCGSNYLTVEDGKIRGAVGAFDVDFEVCGRRLRGRGIGNVAVHPNSRSRGFMKTLMNMALDGMVADGIDLSFLGGRRQRYNYFSFEKCGADYTFSIVSDNIRHVLGEYPADYCAERLDKADGSAFESALAGIADLHDSRPYHAIRPSCDTPANADHLYDILRSWEAAVYVIYRGGEFFGYAIANGSSVKEMHVRCADEFPQAAACLLSKIGGGKITVAIPEYERGYINALFNFAEGYSININSSFSVLNYQRTADALLALKSTYTALPDGELILKINGRAGIEKIKLASKSGAASVTSADPHEPESLSLNHISAMNLLFAPVCPARSNLPCFAQVWLPLPIYIYHTDNV